MRIFLAMPTLWHVDIKMNAFLYALLKTSKHDISIYHTARNDISHARNELIREFLKTNDDYLFFLDDDNPPESIHSIDKLIEARKPVISWLVPSRLPDKQWRHRICVFQEWMGKDWRHEYIQQFTIPEWPDVFEIANCGMGCVLIEREVVKLVAEEYDRPCEMRVVWYYDWWWESWVRDERIDYTKIKDWTVRFRRYMSEDLLFFERAREFGVKLYAHKWVQCEHFGEQNIISIKSHIWKSQ